MADMWALRSGAGVLWNTVMVIYIHENTHTQPETRTVCLYSASTNELKKAHSFWCIGPVCNSSMKWIWPNVINISLKRCHYLDFVEAHSVWEDRRRRKKNSELFCVYCPPGAACCCWLDRNELDCEVQNLPWAAIHEIVCLYVNTPDLLWK